MKRKVISSILTLSILTCQLLPVTYAETGGGNIGDHDSSGGGGTGTIHVTSGWAGSENNFGYRVQFFFDKKGTIDIGAHRGGDDTEFLSPLVSFTAYDGGVTNSTRMPSHDPLDMFNDSGSIREASLGGSGATMRGKQLVGGYFLSNRSVEASAIGKSLFGGAPVNMGQDIVALFGSWVGLSGKLVSKFPMTGSGGITYQIFQTLANTIGITMDDLTRQIYDKLSVDKRRSIARECNNELTGQKFHNLVLPVSENCQVSWAVVVQPYQRFHFKGSSNNTYIPDEFIDYAGHAQGWANLLISSRNFAKSIINKYDTATNFGVRDMLQKDFAPILADRENFTQYGEFKQVKDVILQNFPNSAFMPAGYFGIPSYGGSASAIDILKGGAGLSAHRNVGNHSVGEACCSPAEQGNSVCPCGGDVPCECQVGCPCDGEVPCDCNSGKDIVEDREPETPVIGEDYLTQALEMEGLPIEKTENMYDITYKQDYQGDKITNVFGEVKPHPGYDLDSVGSNGFYVYDVLIDTYKESIQPYIRKGSKLIFPSLEEILNHTYDKDPELNRLKLVGKDSKPIMSLPPLPQDIELQESDVMKPQDGKLENITGKTQWISHRYANENMANKNDYITLAKYMDKSQENVNFKQFASSAQINQYVKEETDGSKLKGDMKQTKGQFKIDAQFGDKAPKKYYREDLAGSSLGFTKLSSTSYTPHETIPGKPKKQIGTLTNPTDIKNKGSFFTNENGDEISYIPEAPKDSSGDIPFDNVVFDNMFNPEVKVEQTYAGGPIAKETPELKLQKSVGSTSITLETPSNVFEFYPTYKMKYHDQVGMEDSHKSVYMLGRQKRTFQYKDKLTVTLSAGAPRIDATWSRDAQDVGGNVAKAGTAYTYTSPSMSINLKGEFYLLDPEFAPDPAKQAKLNQSIINGYVSQIKSVTDSATSSGFGIASSLPYAGSGGASAGTGSFKYPSTGREGISFNPPKVSGSTGGASLTGRLPGIGGMESGRGGGAAGGEANAILQLSLEKDGEVSEESNIKDWYQEDFEGIVKYTVSGSISIPGFTSEVALIHEHLSDANTAPQSYFIRSEYVLGAVSWGSAVANAHFKSPNATITVRGNATDNT